MPLIARVGRRKAAQHLSLYYNFVLQNAAEEKKRNREEQEERLLLAPAADAREENRSEIALFCHRTHTAKEHFVAL